jgi:monofunctional biosynthetic peptidoglycan transglycosylase
MIKLLKWLIVLACFYISWCIIQISWWNLVPPSTTSFMMQHTSSHTDYRWVDYNQISVHMKRAIIAAEDAKFLDHSGFDWDGIERAYKKNKRKGAIVAGGSTISQQLAKNLFLSRERSWWRKVHEAILTFFMEIILSKRRILELYLNVVEWGNGIYGVEAASQYYFKINARQLNQTQASFLASITTQPLFYQKNRSTPSLSKKIKIIQKRIPSARIP